MSLGPSSPQTNGVLTATAATRDPFGGTVQFTYRWRVNGVIKRQAGPTPATTDTFDLSQPGNGDTGDTVTVEAVPNNGRGLPVAGTAAVQIAPPTETPDYNGDGKTDIAVFRPSTGTWYINLSGGGTTVTNWGASGDIAAPGDYNGDGKTDIAVFRPSTGTWYINLSGGGTTVTNWGANGDNPIGGPPGT